MTGKRVKTVYNDGYEVSGSDDFSETTGFFASEQNHSCLPYVVFGVQNCSNDKDKEAPKVKGESSSQTNRATPRITCSAKIDPGRSSTADDAERN